MATVIQLTPNALKDLLEGEVNKEGFVVQVLRILPIDADESNYLVNISDGFGRLDSAFVENAAGEIKNKNIRENTIVRIIAWKTTNVNGVTNILVSGIQIINNSITAVIGFPIDFYELKKNNFVNPRGQNVLRVENLEEVVVREMNPIVRAVSAFGFSGLMGLCAAYFVKKVFRIACFTLGGFFLTLQVMAYNGLITIHWNRFFPNFSLGKLVRMLTYSSAGFGLGFYIGVRKDIRKLF